MIQPRCCGIPGCGYADRRPMASRPVERSRWLDGGSRLLAIAAFCLGLLTAGGVALR